MRWECPRAALTGLWMVGCSAERSAVRKGARLAAVTGDQKAVLRALQWAAWRESSLAAGTAESSVGHWAEQMDETRAAK